MKIIVDISEDDYNRIINKSYWSNDPDYSAAEYAIAHGAVLPQNPTNGEMAEMLFPEEITNKLFLNLINFWEMPYKGKWMRKGGENYVND